jgi:hypothetical protein
MILATSLTTGEGAPDNRCACVVRKSEIMKRKKTVRSTINDNEKCKDFEIVSEAIYVPVAEAT